MNIGISSGVMDTLANTTENTEHYLRQLTREGHDVRIVGDGEACGNLDIYITSKPAEIDSATKIFLSFPEQVGTWWEIYNHIRYEL